MLRNRAVRTLIFSEWSHTGHFHDEKRRVTLCQQVFMSKILILVAKRRRKESFTNGLHTVKEISLMISTSAKEYFLEINAHPSDLAKRI